MPRKSEMRIAVASDVLKRLRARKNPIIAAHQGYLNSNALLDSNTGDLKDYVDEIQKKDCTVCALGAALLSKASLYDAVPLTDIVYSCVDGSFSIDVDGKVIRDLLSDVFPALMMDMMEHAFECDSALRELENLNGVNPKIRAAVAFGFKYNTPKKRLQAIMQNIIDNGGRFVPPKVTKKEYEEVKHRYLTSCRQRKMLQAFESQI